MYWAQTEAFAKNCDAWKEHLEKAKAHIEKAMSLTPTVANIPNPIKKQIDQTKGNGCNP